MILVKSLLLILTSFSFSQQTTIVKLGDRPKECRSQADQVTLTIADEFKSEAQNKLSSNSLTSAIVAGNGCYRVGTEVTFQYASGDIQLLGRAFVNKVQRLTANDLLDNKSLQDYEKSSIEKYLNKNQGKQVSLIYFKVMEQVSNTTLEDQYARLQTCFVSNGDWRSYPLDDEKWKEELDELKIGKKKADIWNGTVNCFKIGVSAKLTAKGVKEELGILKPTKLFLTHYTQVTEEQASILGEKLEDLKKRLAEKKDKFGGYTTMVVYDYEAPKLVEK